MSENKKPRRLAGSLSTCDLHLLVADCQSVHYDIVNFGDSKSLWLDLVLGQSCGCLGGADGLGLGSKVSLDFSNTICIARNAVLHIGYMRNGVLLRVETQVVLALMLYDFVFQTLNPLSEW